MDAALIDNLVVFFTLVYYAFLFVVYLLRAHELSKLEWKLSPVFSVQLVPFASLWVLNLLIGNDSGRLLAGLPIIIYLAYDLWYRAITRKKPYHHPDRWPPGLVVYLLLLLIGQHRLKLVRIPNVEILWKYACSCLLHHDDLIWLLSVQVQQEEES